MKKYWNKFQEFRKNPKKRSIALLIIYGIFFIFVYLYIHSYKNMNNNPEVNVINNEISNYEYSIEYHIEDKIFNIDGIYYDNDNKINIDSNYIIENNIIHLDNNNDLNIDIITKKLDYINIENYLKDYEYDSKTEYKDNNIKYEYTIYNQDLAKYFSDDITNNEISKIDVYKNDYIYEIEIDLSTYYGKPYIIDIKYDNINNISNIENKENT